MSALRHVKPAVRALRPYTLAARLAAVKVNQNENPYDLPADLKRRVLDEALARPGAAIRTSIPASCWKPSAGSRAGARTGSWPATGPTS